LENDQKYSYECPDEKNMTGWESFLNYIKMVYSNIPDSALDWWTDSTLFSFLKICSNVWNPRFVIASLELLTVLACGPECALKAHLVFYDHEKAVLGPMLWKTFFKTLGRHADAVNSGKPIQLFPQESALIHSFLKLTGVVVSDCPSARRVLCENQHFTALTTLFSLLVAKLQLETKAAILKTIACFCKPRLECVQHIQQVWYMLEDSQIVVTVKNSNQTNFGLSHDIREIETPQQTYPESLAFLELIKNLVENAKFSCPTAIYELLGSPDRIGGVKPYITFIIDEIFMKVEARAFKNEAERFNILSICLDIFNTCIDLLDVSEVLLFIASDQRPANDSSPISAIGVHPGFEVVCRILGGFLKLMF
jgi:nuclear pore complex protein Nup205